MGTIAEKLTYLNTTKDKIRDSINLTGANLTSEDTFRSYASKLKKGYVDIINNGIDNLYNNFPKVSGIGSNLSLTPTYEAPIKINEIDGDTQQDGTPTPSNPINIDVVTGRQEINVSNGTDSNTYEVNLGNIELNKIGDYKDRIYKDNGKWYVEKNIEKLILDGSETWTKASEGFYLSNTNFDNITNNNCLSKSALYSNYYKNYTTSTTLMAEDYGIGIIYNVKNLYIRNNDISTANDFKTWLNTHNTIVYYQLITPEYTEITNEELINQLEELYTAKSYEGTTNINVSSENLPMILNAIALSSE